MTKHSVTDLDRALRLLGPLEGRIMREVWSEAVQAPFVVRDVHALMPELAYTTVMTTLNRLADKSLLDVQAINGQRAHVYRAAVDPTEFFVKASREQVEHVLEQFGDAAMVAFTQRLSQLSPEQLRRLEELGRA